MSRLISVEDLKTYAYSVTVNDVALYQDAIDAAEEWMGEQLGRRIATADAAATARLFVPGCSAKYLWIDDCDSVTSVIENGTTLTVGTDYQLESMPGTVGLRAPSGQYRPYCCIRRLGTTWYEYDGTATVNVTAKWGWGTLPPQASEVTKIVAKHWLEYREIKLGTLGISEVGGVSDRDVLRVRQFIQSYRSPRSWGIG